MNNKTPRLLLKLLAFVIAPLAFSACNNNTENDIVPNGDTNYSELANSVADAESNNADIDLSDEADEIIAYTGESPSEYACRRDTNEYKSHLLEIKRLVLAHASIPAKALKEATPQCKEEWYICYQLTEVEWINEKYNSSIVDLGYLLFQYAKADSADIMECFMRYGEFADGYVAEGVFDDLIGLEKKHPKKFAELRELRTKEWNIGYNDWKKIWAD